jgi:hypothetical protein
MQDGDYIVDRSRTLLHMHLQLMRPQDQNVIRQNYDALVFLTFT